MPRTHAPAAALAAALMATLLFSVVSQAGDQRPPAAMHAAFSALDAAWNARDAERFSRLFTEDASLGFVQRSLYLNGRPAILEQFSGQFPRTAPEYSHATEVLEIREIASDVVAVDGTVRILRSRPGDEPPEVFRTFSLTTIAVKSPDGWRFRLMRAYKLPDEEAAEH